MEDGPSPLPTVINTQPHFSFEHDRLSKLAGIINVVDTKRIISIGSALLD